MKKLITGLFLLIAIKSNAQLYFPPTGTNTWDTISPSTLGWCQDKLDTLLDYMGQHNTKAFMILKDGKIVVEKYYGTFTVDSIWYWASAGKSLTSFLIGLAQEQGYLNINDSLPKYLGHGFSSCTTSGEDSIRIIHQLTMTSGFDDMPGGATSQYNCTDDTCLFCLAPPGSRWAYHNAPYTMTHWVIDSATGITTNAFKTNNLQSCGITGLFIPNGYDDVYYSKARSFARFGLLMLAKGIWDNDTIMYDTAYFNQMINTSQNLNLAYGYLWWLNGKSSYRLPNTQIQINGPLSVYAPADMYSALGKNDQILDVVPSMNLVLIRMGDPFGLPLDVATVTNDSIWIRLNDVFCNSSSVNEFESGQHIQVFPNPASGNFTISFPNNGFDIIVYDAFGRKITERKNCINETQFNSGELSAGAYFIQLRNKSNRIYNRTLIVSNQD